jgi:hypothetical protein
LFPLSSVAFVGLAYFTYRMISSSIHSPVNEIFSLFLMAE